MSLTKIEEATRLTNPDLCRLLGVSKQLMYHHRKTGSVPPYIAAHIDTLLRMTPAERERVIQEKLGG